MLTAIFTIINFVFTDNNKNNSNINFTNIVFNETCYLFLCPYQILKVPRWIKKSDLINKYKILLNNNKCKETNRNYNKCILIKEAYKYLMKKFDQKKNQNIKEVITKTILTIFISFIFFDLYLQISHIILKILHFILKPVFCVLIIHVILNGIFPHIFNNEVEVLIYSIITGFILFIITKILLYKLKIHIIDKTVGSWSNEEKLFLHKMDYKLE